MDAESREAVFQELRKKGVKAIKVIAADGSKANGEVRGIRKRVLFASVVGAAILAGTISALVVGRGGGVVDPDLPLDDTTRHQVIGDIAVIEKGIMTGWGDVFAGEGERFLASFAIPGVKAGQRNTTVEELNAALNRKVGIEQGDGIEARQIKAMVEGMKEEARKYIAAGGTVVEYGKRLTERQDAEIAIYERVKVEIKKAKTKMHGRALLNFWEKQNNQLRPLGIKLVPMPE